MKRYWIEYTEKSTPGPLTAWMPSPAAPTPVAAKSGHAVYFVEVDGFTFQFASLDELRVCIDVLGKKLLPNTLRQAEQLGRDPDEHWLRKMPDKTKPWRYREKAVKYLSKALAHFERSEGV
jgi:hypothetical protein